VADEEVNALITAYKNRFLYGNSKILILEMVYNAKKTGEF